MVLSEATYRRDTSVSIVVLAFNEAPSLPDAIEAIKWAVEGEFSKYEIIIVNDGSGDNTGEVADIMASGDPVLKSVHNRRNMGCGFTFWQGARAASCEYVWLMPGDGEIDREAIRTISDHIGTADMVIPYASNTSVRPLSRRFFSRGYTVLLNMLFGQKLHYYNGPCVIRTELLKKAPVVNSRCFAFMAPILLRLIKREYTYVEVGIKLRSRSHGQPSIRYLQYIFSTVGTVARMFWDINGSERLRAGKT